MQVRMTSRPRQPDFDALHRRREMDRLTRVETQAKARVNAAIDWSVCLVPGCGEELIDWPDLQRASRGDSSMDLPLCHAHTAVVWHRAVGASITDPRLQDELAQVRERKTTEEADIAARAQAKYLARTNGDIYFVRLNHLIKVGWTRDLEQRLKSYGASVEVLVYYPATRDDETSLHRQLRPALAKGREWYHDGPILQRFIVDALAQYGEPTLSVYWTKPKQIVAGKRHR